MRRSFRRKRGLTRLTGTALFGCGGSEELAARAYGKALQRSLSGIPHGVDEALGELQVLTALGTAQKVIFECGTLILGKAAKKICLRRLIRIGGAWKEIHAAIVALRIDRRKTRPSYSNV